VLLLLLLLPLVVAMIIPDAAILTLDLAIAPPCAAALPSQQGLCA
jgi:hypothetical protein